MRRIARAAALLSVVAAMAAALGSGCFKPDKPACAFSCATPPHDCPAGFVCGADFVCHNPNSTGICLITTDAGIGDAPARDGDVDGEDAAPSADGTGADLGVVDGRADGAGTGG